MRRSRFASGVTGRLIQQGGVKVDGEKITEKKAVISASPEATLIQAGKRKFRKVFFEVE